MNYQCRDACGIINWTRQDFETKVNIVEIQSHTPVEDAYICNKPKSMVEGWYIGEVSRLLNPSRLLYDITQFIPDSIVPPQDLIYWMYYKLTMTRFCILSLSNFRMLMWAFVFICLMRYILIFTTAFWTRIIKILCYRCYCFTSNPCKHNLHDFWNKN